MKTFELSFYRSHQRLSNQYAKMNAQAKSLETVLPRIKKILVLLNKLPNPYDHTKWILTNISELKKNDS